MPDAQAPPLLEPQFLHRLEQLELVSRKIFLGRLKGERRSKRKGQSVEFADFRNYVPGDDLRFIDWNLYARLDRLFIKLFLEEEDLHFFCLIDTSTSMEFGEPTKLLYAKQLAAALARHLTTLTVEEARQGTCCCSAGGRTCRRSMRRSSWPRSVSYTRRKAPPSRWRR